MALKGSGLASARWKSEKKGETEFSVYNNRKKAKASLYKQSSY